MSLARFLARHIAKSAWGAQRGLGGLSGDEEAIHRFARVITMPGDLVMEISEESRTPQLISLHFEVPEEDARLRLQELARLRGLIAVSVCISDAQPGEAQRIVGADDFAADLRLADAFQQVADRRDRALSRAPASTRCR